MPCRYLRLDKKALLMKSNHQIDGEFTVKCLINTTFTSENVPVFFILYTISLYSWYVI